MSEKSSLKYLENPEKYCEYISTLIQDGSDEWQTVWKAAIPELFQNSNLSQSPSNNINAINTLLKVIERAFKERVYRIRVQAFECWEYFITIVENYVVTDKLLNVLLIPLCASNHSIYEVLHAKLKTFAALIDSNLILKPTITKKAVPNLLKILYGPHNLRPATEFDELIEVSGAIYLKVVKKCISLEVGYTVSTYLEKAIPALNKNENAQQIAEQVWRCALEHMSRNNWPTGQFNHLMKTFENLISCDNQSGNVLVGELLSILIEEYAVFPIRCFMLHVRLLTRCLFYCTKSDKLSKMMDCLLKKCKNGGVFFIEIGQTLDDFSDEYKDKLQDHWVEATNFFLNWIKSNPVSEDSDWILLLPIKHMHAEWNPSIESQVQKCHDEICSATNGNLFIKNVLQKLCTFLEESENVPVSLLNASIALCKVILKNCKHSVFNDGICNMRFLLKTVYKKLPSQNVTDAAYKSFIPKFVATVLFYMDNYSDYADEFTPIIQNYSQFLKEDDKSDKDELSVIQVISKYTNLKNDDESNDSVLRLSNGINVPASGKTPTPGKTKRGSFLARLSPAVDKKQPSLGSPRLKRIPETPKSQKSFVDDNEVQFIAVKTKPKNSPMTEHQKEKAKSKSYIPPLYEDLSQSQSQSLIESSSSLENDKPTSKTISDVEYFEENANLPSTMSNSEQNDDVQKAVTFHNYCSNSSTTDNPVHVFSSKKSLFNDGPKKPDHKTGDNSVNAHVQMVSENRVLENILIEEENDGSSNNGSVDVRPGTKRRSVRMETKTDPTPVKRSKRSEARDERKSIEKSRNRVEKPQNRIENVTKRLRGRPRTPSLVNPAVKTSENMDTEVINLIDSESQNLFVSQTPGQMNKSTTISNPLPSFMSVKSSENNAKMRRKSLKSKPNDPPVRSPISTRKRMSLVNENIHIKRVYTPLVDESYSEISLADDKNTKNETPNFPGKTVSFENDENCTTVSKISSSTKKVASKNSPTKTPKGRSTTGSPRKSLFMNEDASTTDNDPVIFNEGETMNHINENLSYTNSSVVIIENNSPAEVISIVDSESQTAFKDNSTQEKLIPPNESQILAHEDESTYFENAEVQVTKNTAEVTSDSGDFDKGNDKEQSVEPSVLENSLQGDSSDRSFPEELVIEESLFENLNNQNSGCDKNSSENKARSSPDISEDLVASSAINKSVTERIADVSTLIDILSSPISSPPNVVESSASDETSNAKKEKTASPLKPREPENDKNNEIVEVSEGKKNSTSQIADKNEAQQTDEDESKGNTSPISNNTRTIKIMRLVYDSQNVTKPKNSTKVNKSPVVSSGLGVSNFKATSTNQRAMKMLMANGNIDKSRTSPTKIITTPTERLKYVSKECTSPGILKKPDLNGSVSSPRSAKFVNFAEQLTDTRTYDVDEEDFDDSDRPSNNLLGDEEGMSQDVLYSPLLNCRDDVKNITERLSLSKQALDLFRRMGIETVGQLASVSTITAKSIPAGDNRLQRLRKALQEYEEYRVSMYASRGLRTPSARRRIVYRSQENKMDVSSIVELMSEIEPVENTSPSAEIEPQLTNKICKLSVEIKKLDSEFCSAKTSLPTVELKKLDNELCAAKIARPTPELQKFDATVAQSVVETEKLDEICPTETIASVVDVIKPDAVSSVIKIGLPTVEIQKLDDELCVGKIRLPAVEIEKLDNEFCASIINKCRSPSKSPEKSMSPTKRSNIEETSKENNDRVECVGSGTSPNVEMQLAENDNVQEQSKTMDDEEVQATKVNDAQVQLTNDDYSAQSAKNDSGIETNVSPVDEQSCVVENTTADLVNEKEAVETQPMIMDVEMKNVVTESIESQHDMSDDSDFICTANDEVECRPRNLRSYSRLVAARVSTSLHSSTPSSSTSSRNIALSPEIITVDLDVSDEHHGSDKETSVSIFSPNMNERSENGDDIEHDDHLQSPSNDVCEERLTPGIENIVSKIVEDERQNEKVTFEKSQVETSSETVFQELMFNILKPYLSISCLKELMRNEEIARSKLLELILTLEISIEKHNLRDWIKTELKVLKDASNKKS